MLSRTLLSRTRHGVRAVTRHTQLAPRRPRAQVGPAAPHRRCAAAHLVASFSSQPVAGEQVVQDPLPTPKVVTQTGERFLKMKEDYLNLTVPEGMDRDEIYRKRLVYRSQQRGWLEVDLMLGNFAKEHVAQFSPEECQEYEIILELETVDILNLLLERDAPPPELEGSHVLALLLKYCRDGAVNSMDLLHKGNQ